MKLDTFDVTKLRILLRQTRDGERSRAIVRSKKRHSVSTLSMPRSKDRGVEWVDKLRKEVDKLDKNLIELLAERFKLVKQIKIAKNELKLSIKNRNREKEVLVNILNESRKYKLNKSFVSGLFNKIINESIRIEYDKS